MKTWFTSLNGAITLTVIALLTYLGRTFIDFQFVYVEFAPGVGMATLAVVINMALFGGWFWGLLAAVRGSRRGLIAALVFDLFFLFAIAVGTLVAYCPSPCNTAWPLAEIVNWANIVFGTLAAVAVGLHLKAN